MKKLVIALSVGVIVLAYWAQLPTADNRPLSGVVKSGPELAGLVEATRMRDVEAEKQLLHHFNTLRLTEHRLIEQAAVAHETSSNALVYQLVRDASDFYACHTGAALEELKRRAIVLKYSDEAVKAATNAISKFPMCMGATGTRLTALLRSAGAAIEAR